VCPFNDGAPVATDPALRPRFATGTVDLRALLAWRKGQGGSPLRHSAMRRVKLEVLQRNARIVERNLERNLEARRECDGRSE
jgi:epoxyqueuosine reductase QueG